MIRCSINAFLDVECFRCLERVEESLGTVDADVERRNVRTYLCSERTYRCTWLKPLTNHRTCQWFYSVSLC